ncbi:AraC family transcriptional regulator [Paenibacillus sp. YIM B09110]|uniref:AraC family transcriptional regulator n=1 Tax=Paenibacillus sp. YIM B09110 TaxID=3126102 RepID=UPI00301D4546
MNTESVFVSYVEFAQSFAMDLYNNPEIQTAILSGDNSWNDRLQTALDQINRNLRINKYMYSVYVLNKDGLVFNVEKVPVTDESKTNIYRYIQQTSMRNSPQFWKLHSRSNGESLNTMTVYFKDYAQNDSFEGAIAVNVDMDELQTSLFARQNVGQQSLFILDRNGNVIMQGGLTKIGQSNAVQHAMESRLSPDVAYDSFVTTIDNQSYVFSYASMDGGKYYVALQEAYTLTMGELVKTRNVMLSLCAALLLVIVMVSLFLSQRLYSPIGRMFMSLRQLADHRMEKRADGNELELMNDTILTVEQRIISLEHEIDSNTVIKLLISPVEGEDKLTGDLLVKSRVIRTIDAPFCVIQLRIDRYKSWIFGINATEVSYRLKSLSTLFCEVFKDIAHCTALQTTEGQIALIVSELEEEPALSDLNLPAIVKQIQESLKVSYKIAISCGISSIADDVRLMKAKYNESQSLIQYRIVYGNDAILNADVFTHTQKSEIAISEIDSIVSAIKKGDFEQYLQALDHLFVVSRSYHFSKIVNALARLILSLEQLSNDVVFEKSQTQHSHLHDIYNQICLLDNHHDLRDWLDRLFEMASNSIAETNAKKTLNVVTDAMEYVHSHYHDPQLSVHRMADKLMISVPYFSKLFNDSMGSSFPDYVNNLRLEKAMLLLSEEPDLDIGEIAGRVGYNSGSYFATLFKKKYGVSPSKYRLNLILRT